jgi:outer membrane protein assembly factor BamB
MGRSINFAQLRRNGTAGVLLVFIATTCSILAIIATLQSHSNSAQQPIERYLGAYDGASTVFRVDAAPERVIRRSINVAARSASDIIVGHAEAAASIIDLLKPGWGEDYGLAEIISTRIIVVRAVDEESSYFTRTLSIGLLHGSTYSIVEQEYPGLRLVYSPPLPVLNIGAEIGNADTSSGRVTFPLTESAAPYTATFRIEKRHAVDLGSDRFDDCLTTATTLRIGSLDFGTSRSTFCAGVGEISFRNEDAQGKLLDAGAAIRITTRAPSAIGPAPETDFALRHTERSETDPESKWTYPHSERISSIYAAPTIDHDSVFVGNYFGEVVALDRADGNLRWRFQTGGPIFAAPVVKADTLLTGSADRSLYALRAKTGALLWSFRTADAIVASPAVSGSIAYVGSEDGTLFALDFTTGELLHSFSTGGAIAAAPVPYGDLVYVASESGALFALDAHSLAVRWAFAAGSPLSTSPLVTADAVFVGDFADQIHALDTHAPSRSGVVIWSTKLPSTASGSLTTARDMVFATTDDRIHALAASTGAIEWSTAKSSYYGSAVTNGERLHVATRAGVAAYSTRDGALLWTTPISDSGRLSAVETAGDWLYAGDSHGDVRAILAATQEQIR